MHQMLAPGAFVQNPDRPDWGLGQIQSAVGERLTVNFENAGKLAINARLVGLAPAKPDAACQDLDMKPRHCPKDSA